MAKSNHTTVAVYDEPYKADKSNYVTSISVPIYLFPNEIQELNQEIVNRRAELRSLERELREKLASLFSHGQIV